MHRRVVLALAWLGLFSVPLVSSYATLTVLKSSPRTHRARVAKFGNEMTEGVANYANLMLPPNEFDPFMCEEPDLGLLDTSEESLDGAATLDIALLVSRGECTFERKARNAAKLQKNTTLRYIVVYNNDNDNPKDVLVMSAASPEDEIRELDRLSLVFVNTEAGENILSQISEYSVSVGKSPFFLNANEGAWNMPIIIEKLPPPEDNGQPPAPGPPFASSSNRGSSSSNMFYWLRFVLFALLIVAPCMRALYLWWAGGGRFYLRRNENGRITGLQYVRPIQYWFAGGPAGSEGPNQNVVERLTKEQFLALPVIEYQSPSSETAAEGMEAQSDTEEPEQSEETSTISPHEASVDNFEEGARLSTSCTTCSICIDDFEDGERLCLLPRCHHGFHPDCILPWLTERQGCCPLCKTNVLQEEPNTEADTDVEASFDTSSHEDQQTSST